MAEETEFNLVTEQRDGYLYVEYAGNPLTLDMILKTINVVADALRTSGLKRVLLVRDAPILDSDANRALTAKLISNTSVPGVKYAIVDKFGNDREKTARAVEYSRTAGWDLTGFDTIEEAQQWLKIV